MKRGNVQPSTRKQQLEARGVERRQYELSTEQFQELERICEELGIVSPTFNKGEPSIGGLLRGIADRQLIVLRDPEPPSVLDVYNERMARSRNRSIMQRIKEP